MSRLTLNKSALHREREQLKLYRHVLPSLELKRQQLNIELQKTKKALDERKQQAGELEVMIADQTPMLANREISLSGFVNVTDVITGEDNIAGVKLPNLAEMKFHLQDYSMLGKPHWFDLIFVKLQELSRAEIIVTIFEERVRRLERARLKVMQRINLFEKILIPETLQNIKRIQIVMADAERAAVVRSKLAKARH